MTRIAIVSFLAIFLATSALSDRAPYVPVAPETSVSGSATGFFHAEQIDGQDWIVDPAGRAIPILAIDHVRPFAWKDRNLGYDVYRRYVETNYPSKTAWVDETLERLRAWGFNTLANDSNEPLLRNHGMAHAETLYLGGKFATGDDPDRWIEKWSGCCTGFPNVFHPDFEATIRERAQVLCARERDNPWLLGWFLDNELKWWGPQNATHTSLALFDVVRALPPGHSARKALEEFVAGRPVSNALREDFLRLVAERYFEVLCSAVREADPDHMILGCRFASPFLRIHPVVWEACGKYCDVVTFNCYPWADIDYGIVLDEKNGGNVTNRFREFHRWAGKPLMITEWSFPALDSGLPCTGGAGQRFHTQAQRAKASGLFARTLLSLPFMVGYSYFMFPDMPASGISKSFAEDSNYGIIDKFGRPYEALVSVLSKVQNGAVALHASVAQKAGSATCDGASAAATDSSERERYWAEAARAKAAGGLGVAVATILPAEKDGTDACHYVLSNSFVCLSGQIGSRFMVGEIAYAKNPSEPSGGFDSVGRWGALLKGENGGVPYWVDVSCVKSAVAELDETTGIASLVIRAEGSGSTAVADGVAPASLAFAITHRLSLVPNSAEILAEIVSVENTSDESFLMTQLMMRPFAIETTPAETPSVPNLWKGPVEGYWLLSDGSRWGVESFDQGVLGASLLQYGDKQHPDVRCMAGGPCVLEPGQVWTPPLPMASRIRRR